MKSTAPSAMVLALLSHDHTCMSGDLKMVPHAQMHNQIVILKRNCDRMAALDKWSGIGCFTPIISHKLKNFSPYWDSAFVCVCTCWARDMPTLLPLKVSNISIPTMLPCTILF